MTLNLPAGQKYIDKMTEIVEENYTNSSGSLKTKTLTTVTSDVSGNISLPLPTHRDDRNAHD